MGYTTDFSGKFNLDKKLTAAHMQYLIKFAGTRRMQRDSKKTAKLKDPLRIAAGLDVGIDGEFYVGAGGVAGQEETSDITNYNSPPSTQPGLWCQWAPTSNGMGIEWDGGEKFYNYVEWIEYIIAKFLKPWGYTVNGEVEWQGEDGSDIGKIFIKNNEVTTKVGKKVFE